MDEQNIDSALPQEKPKKASKILIALNVILYAINCLLSYAAIDFSNIRGTAELNGTIIAQMTINLLIPLFIVALFQLRRAFRNFRSIVKIFFWASLVLLFLNFGNL